MTNGNRSPLRRIRRSLAGHLGRGSSPARVHPPVCHDLVGWAATYPGADSRVLDPPGTITRRLPRTVEPQVHPDFVRLSSFELPERALVKIPRGRVRGAEGIVILPSGEYPGELVALTREGRHQVLEGQWAYFVPQPERAEPKAGAYYPLLGLTADHYYHWCHDIVMRMRRAVDLLPPDTTLLVPERMAPFQEEALALLDLGDRRVLPFPPDGYWELEELYVISPILKAQIDTADPYLWFRERALARYDVTPGPPTRRFYLTRRHDRHWRTVNEPEVEELLARHGFETVAPGTMTLREQIELFARAEMIVGAGAGLFNMLFAPGSARVLQLQESDHMELALWMMADALGLEYHYLTGAAVPNPEGRQADIRVPLDGLEASLTAMTTGGTPR